MIGKQQFHYRISELFSLRLPFVWITKHVNKRSTFRLSFTNLLTPKSKSFPTMLSIIIISAHDRTKAALQNVLICMSSEIKKRWNLRMNRLFSLNPCLINFCRHVYWIVLTIRKSYTQQPIEMTRYSDFLRPTLSANIALCDK